MTFTTSGGGAPVALTVRLTQLGAPATLTLSSVPLLDPLDPISAAGGTVEFTVSLVGSATSWEVSASGAGFSMDPLSGVDGETTTLTYTRNSDITERMGKITFTPMGTAPVDMVLDLTQRAGQGISVVSDPTADLTSLTAAGGTFTLAVTTSGSATGWTAAITDGSGFVSIDKTASGTPDPPNTITVTYNENVSTDNQYGFYHYYDDRG